MRLSIWELFGITVAFAFGTGAMVGSLLTVLFVIDDSSMVQIVMPSSQPTTNMPTISPTLSNPTTTPTKVPTMSVPTRVPTCLKPVFVDLIWIIDGSSSMNHKFQNATRFISDFINTTTISPDDMRMGYIEFSGPFGDEFRTVVATLNVTDPIAQDTESIRNSVLSLVPEGGTSATADAIDYVRINMFTPDNLRAGSKRIVVLLSDGNPTDSTGSYNITLVELANQAALNIRQEDDVIFVFVKVGTDYNPALFQGIVNHVYQTTDFSTLNNLLAEDFMCFDISEAPTISTQQPTTECIPGNVTCCFAVTQRMTEFWVNNIDITSTAQQVDGNNITSSTYVISFIEPSTTAVMVIKNFESSVIYSAGLRLICICDRIGSPWNFFSQVDTGFRSISTRRDPNFQSDNFHPGYNLNNYTGPSSAAIGYSGPSVALNLTTLMCGPQDPTKSLGHPQGLSSPPSWYWGLRREVVQTTICGTNSPISSMPSQNPTRSPSISSPSSIPTRSPSISSPSLIPTQSPSTSSPSLIPTNRPTQSPSLIPTQSPSTSSPSLIPTNRPTQSPSTSSPSLIPTQSPSTQSPSLIPTQSPSTSSPSLIPTNRPSLNPTRFSFPGKTPEMVTCCFSGGDTWTEIWVDEEELTTNSTPPVPFNSSMSIYEVPNTFNLTYMVSFWEPDHVASIAIKGVGVKEIIKGHLMLRCNCTNATSKWNFISIKQTGIESWKTVSALSQLTDSFPPQWYNNTYTGTGLAPPTTTTQLPTYSLNDKCGISSNQIRTSTAYTHAYWVFRRMINPFTPPVV